MNQAETAAALAELVRGIEFPHDKFFQALPAFCWITHSPVVDGIQFHVTAGINGDDNVTTGLIMLFFPLEPQDAPEAGRIVINEKGQGDITLPRAKYRIDFIAPEPMPESEPATSE